LASCPFCQTDAESSSLSATQPFHNVGLFFSELQQFRAIATRFEKHDINYLALVKVAVAKIWMLFMSR